MKVKDYDRTLKLLHKMESDEGYDYPRGWQEALRTTIRCVKARRESEIKLAEIKHTLAEFMGTDEELDPSWTFDNKED